MDVPPPRSGRKGGVRRKAVNPRSENILLRVTPARKEQIRAEAEAAGLTITDYLLRNEPGVLQFRAMPRTAADPKMLARILGELGKWGGNWNQLARDRNMTGQEPELDELRRIGTAIWDMRGEVLKALGRAD
jgi:hypothetical protein